MSRVALECLCELVVDCPHSTPTWTESGALVFRSNNIRGGRLDLSEKSFTTEDEFIERTRRAMPLAGDLIITREAPMGEVAMVPPGIRGCLGQRMVLLRPDRSRVNARFLLYSLLSAPVQEQIRWHEGTGSTVSNLRIPALKALKIPLLPRDDQDRAASLLAGLDDKIDLNLRMNETLEAMARALFKSWFVDFDPVRAKSEGRVPSGMDEETAELFPSEFDDWELGKLPRGWQQTPVLEFADLISGGTPKTSVAEYWGGSIKWASAKDVSQCGTFFLLETERTITEAGVENSAAKLLPADCVVVVSRGATCGRFAVLAEPMAMNQTCYALRARDSAARWYLRFVAEELVQRLVFQAHGSVFDTITTATFERARIVVPTRPLLAAFEHIVDPLVERIRTNQRESGTLAALRDALLPKLLSGELCVGGADRIVERRVIA